MLFKCVKNVGIVETENLLEKEDLKENNQKEFENNLLEKRVY